MVGFGVCWEFFCLPLKWCFWCRFTNSCLILNVCPAAGLLHSRCGWGNGSGFRGGRWELVGSQESLVGWNEEATLPVGGSSQHSWVPPRGGTLSLFLIKQTVQTKTLAPVDLSGDRSAHWVVLWLSGTASVLPQKVSLKRIKAEVSAVKDLCLRAERALAGQSSACVCSCQRRACVSASDLTA